MNISLPPSLHDAVRERVGSGAYVSASEVVREALRLLQAVLDLQFGRRTFDECPEFSRAEWKELRAALLRGEAMLQHERVRALDGLFLSGLRLMRERFKREMCGATEAEIDAAVSQWLRDRAGDDREGSHEASGHTWFRPVSKKRFERIVRGA